jgi:hypothetical protein
VLDEPARGYFGGPFGTAFYGRAPAGSGGVSVTVAVGR